LEGRIIQNGKLGDFLGSSGLPSKSLIRVILAVFIYERETRTLALTEEHSVTVFENTGHKREEVAE
jgi:hypothetical protein